jgi:hypothetical protein
MGQGKQIGQPQLARVQRMKWPQGWWNHWISHCRIDLRVRIVVRTQ